MLRSRLRRVSFVVRCEPAIDIGVRVGGVRTDVDCFARWARVARRAKVEADKPEIADGEEEEGEEDEAADDDDDDAFTAALDGEMIGVVGVCRV